ncbi:MAG TPA: hypothetical protein VJZ91_02685 [Blastocatellia bacterium]|nr:hypothetical protein [Blastocatellia bacterium]
MGRFARNSERENARDDQSGRAARPPATGWPRSTSRGRQAREDNIRTDSRAPSEMKYFVLAIAALIGLGIGWLSGKAITNRMLSTVEPHAAVEAAAPATPEALSEKAQPAPTSEDVEAANAQTALPDAADSADADAPTAVVTQVATDDARGHAGRRVARRVAVRREGRGNVFVRPFKALRKFRIW